MPKVMAMILAGGAGTRLEPLTRERAKPAVPFGGRYRIIDFALSNFANSGIYRMKVLTQYKSDSLNNHLSRAWRMTAFLGHYVDTVPAQMRTGLDWYKGSEDAIYQYLNLIKNSSLGAGIAYFELTNVTRITVGNGSPAVPAFALALAIYVVISLVTSLGVNLANRRFKLVER